MSSAAWGFVAGLLVAAALAGAMAAWAYRRFVLLERRTQQAERLAEIGALTGGLAHEIKNPLSTIQLNLQLLKEDLTPENSSYSRLLSRLQTVQRETARLREILEGFLRYAGRIELEIRPVNLNQVLDELVDFFSAQAQAHRVQLRLKKPAQDVHAGADAKLLKQAILNLMLNALQAMPQGGDLILSLSVQGKNAVIDVIDTGAGIPPEVLPRIFQAYYTTKRGGSGIGLPMTRRIVEEHGATISVRSEVGKGSDFTIHLPLR